MQRVYVFDVDGTIIDGDSLRGLVKYLVPGFLHRMKIWMRLMPKLFAGSLTGDLAPAKLALLSALWKGKKKLAMQQEGRAYFEAALNKTVKKKAVSYMAELKVREPTAIIVLLSASCGEWLQPVADFFEAGLIATELEYDGNLIFTGNYSSPNCKGQEKVRRLLQKFPPTQYEFVCFGNSAADKALKSVSQQFFYRYF